MGVKDSIEVVETLGAPVLIALAVEVLLFFGYFTWVGIAIPREAWLPILGILAVAQFFLWRDAARRGEARGEARIMADRDAAVASNRRQNDLLQAAYWKLYELGYEVRDNKIVPKEINDAT